MKKMKPLNHRLIVNSRGIKEPEEGEVIVPEQYLKNSDVCKTEDGGVTIIKKEGSGVEIGETSYIIEQDDVLAVQVDGHWEPSAEFLIIRKALDPTDESGLVSLHKRSNRFAEILAAGSKTRLENDIGNFAYIAETGGRPQKIEETLDDWIIHSDLIEFVIGG